MDSHTIALPNDILTLGALSTRFNLSSHHAVAHLDTSDKVSVITLVLYPIYSTSEPNNNV